MSLLSLLTDQRDLFTRVASFLTVGDSGILCCLNKVFQNELGEMHPMWQQHGATLLGISVPKPKQDGTFNWKSTVALLVASDPMKLKDPLLNLIQDISMEKSERHVECCGTIIAEESQPEFFIPVAGMKLDLPLESSKLQKLIDDGICERAPFGRGTETIVDLETRKCWRLMMGKDVVQLNGKFADLVNQSSQGMDPTAPLRVVKEKMMPHLFADEGGEICAQPYSMLIYEEGSFFSNHRDTLRGPNHFGSLVVSLPVDCDSEGGELVLTSFASGFEAVGAAKENEETSSGKLKTEIIHSRPNQNECCKYHAFFTDVYHEVKPVAKGYRVALTFHLWVLPKNIVSRPVFSLSTQADVDLKTFLLGRVLESFFKRTGKEYRFVFALDHSYSTRTLNKENMRGRDWILHEVMHTARGDSQFFAVDLKKLSVERFSKPKNCKKYKKLDIIQEYNYGEWHPSWDLSRKTIWINQELFLAMEHETSEYSYDTGNEGYQADFKYDHACMIIQHPDFGEDEGY